MPQRKKQTVSNTGTITWFQYWRKDKPIPRGWEMDDDLQTCHHGEYAVLLVKKSKCVKK